MAEVWLSPADPFRPLAYPKMFVTDSNYSIPHSLSEFCISNGNLVIETSLQARCRRAVQGLDDCQRCLRALLHGAIDPATPSVRPIRAREKDGAVRLLQLSQVFGRIIRLEETPSPLRELICIPTVEDLKDVSVNSSTHRQ